MDISITVDTGQQDDQSWLGSAHGTSATRTITLDATKFTGLYPNGYIPSGTALGIVTASGKFGPYDNAAADGRQTLIGHLFTAVKVPTDTSKPIGASLYEHGRVRLVKLPFQSGLGSVDAAGQADVKGQIIYVS